MKRVAKKVTLQTLDRKIDVLGQTLDRKIDVLGQTLDKKIDDVADIVEALAVSTKKGFDEVHEFRDEMLDFKKKTEMTLFSMDSKLQTVDQRLDAIEKTLGPLVHASSFYQGALREHEHRIALLERRASLSKS